MNKILKSFYWCIFLAANCIPGKGQIPKEPVSIQSPNIASLGLYQDMPVSYFTGLPVIEVPLYTIQEKKINIPISLNYHASGFRPDMHPGWVGLGWNLSIGGVISRIIKDVPDDYNNPNYYKGANSGFYFNFNKLNVSNWDQLAYMKSIAQGDEMLYDTEPDEFSFSFPGGSGKFFLDHTGNWKVKCSKPVKVIFNNQFLDVPFSAPSGTRIELYGNFKSFSGFTIIDESGIQYLFGNDTNAIEYSIGFFSQDMDEWLAESWYLTKIIHPDGNEVNFTYEKDNLINQMYISIYNNLQTRTVSSGNIFNPQPSCSSWEYRSVYASCSGKLISPSYLKCIEGDNTRVSFLRSNSVELRYSENAYEHKYTLWSQGSQYTQFLPFLSMDFIGYPQNLSKLQWKKLDKIEVGYKNAQLKSYQFNYTNNPAKRLTLLSVAEVGGDMVVKPAHQFFYDTSQTLPDYLANKTDHWGFYNGTYADISDINTYYTTYYSYREPDATYLPAGTLNKIVYPTGGVTEFTYEPHQYNKRLKFIRTDGIDPTFNQKTTAGGLRIKKIESYESANPSRKNSKEYYYVAGYNSTSNVNSLSSSGILGGQVKYYFDDYRSEAFNDNGVVYSKSIFSSQSVLPATVNSQGCHIGYSEVVEKRTDGSYSKYYFTNFDSGHIDESSTVIQITRTAYEPYSSLEEERGLLWKEENYSDTDILLLKKEIEYVALNKSNEYVRALSARYFNVCNETAVSCAEGAAYRNYVYSYLPSVVTEQKFDQSGDNPLTVSKIYTYDIQTRLIKTELFTNSKGQSNKTIYVYPKDYILPTGVTDPATLAIKSLQEKNIVSPVIEQYVQKSISGGSGFQTISASYVSYKSTSSKPEFVFVLNQRQPIVDFVPSFVSSGAIIKDSRYLKILNNNSYDSFGNLLEQQKDNDVKQSFIWDYKSSYPVAQVVNAPVSDIAYTSFESDGKGNWSYTGIPVPDDTAPTGRKIFKIVSTANNITKTGLGATTTYIVSYWKKSGTVSVNSTTPATGKTINGWTYYEHKVVNPSGGTITVSGTNGIIDELRLYPSGAQMTTYTYDPLIGMSSQCDPNNRITYYEYDSFSRLVLERDQDKNIIRQTCYNYAGQVEDCQVWIRYYNQEKSGMATRNNCGAGKTGSQVTYMVETAKYVSVISQADADNQAQADVDANKQAYANANGACTIIKIPVTLKNVGAEGNDHFYVSFSAKGGTAYSTHFNNIFLHPEETYTKDVNWGAYDITIESKAGYTMIFSVNGELKTGSIVTYTNVSITGAFTIYAAAYQNTTQNVTYTRNNCPSGYNPTSVVYVVAAGIYTSVISQADANQGAITATSTAGQAYANANGLCVPQGPANTDIIYTNSLSKKVTLTLTNVSTSVVYTFSLNKKTTQGMAGSIPTGYYNVTMHTNGATDYYSIESYVQSIPDTDLVVNNIPLLMPTTTVIAY